MQRKLLFLLFLTFIFSGTKTTFSSTENKNKKRKRLLKNEFLNTENLQKQNTQDSFQNALNFVPPSTNIIQCSNIQNQESVFNLLKSKDETYFYFHSNLLKTPVEVRSNDPSDLLNKLLEISNTFRFIFPYLSLFELELDIKCISKKFYDLYEKFLQEEKTFLQSCLKKEEIFLANINYTRQYFDFFEKRLWNGPKRIEYANVDYFDENLTLLPKSIRQMISFKFNNIQYKYVLFKNGHLSILKQNIGGKFVWTSLENDFEAHYPFQKETFKLDFSFQENIRWLDIWNVETTSITGYVIGLCKNNNFRQAIWHSETHQKIRIYRPVRKNKRVFLKNLSGYVEFCSSVMFVEEFEKQNDGIYKTKSYDLFKPNIKEIKSQDFEHYVGDLQFIFKTIKKK